MTIHSELEREASRLHAWRLHRRGSGLTKSEYDAAPKDGLTTSTYLGSFFPADVPAEATHTEPASPRLVAALALARDTSARIVGASLSSGGVRIDLDDGRAVIDGALLDARSVACHDRVWLAVARGDRR